MTWTRLWSMLRWGSGVPWCWAQCRGSGWPPLLGPGCRWVLLGTGGMKVPSSPTSGAGPSGAVCLVLGMMVGLACGGLAPRSFFQPLNRRGCICQLLVSVLEIQGELLDVILEMPHCLQQLLTGRSDLGHGHRWSVLALPIQEGEKDICGGGPVHVSGGFGNVMGRAWLDSI